MSKKQKDYYSTVYMALLDAGLKPLDTGCEYRLNILFKRNDRRWADLDNLVKSFMDAGQPSKWSSNKMMVDFWDDKQIYYIAAERSMGNSVGTIAVEILKRKTD